MSLGGESFGRSPPKSGKCSARGVRVCVRACECACVGEVWFVWWFGSVEIVVVFLLSAAVAVGCFGLRRDVSKRKGNVSAYVAT